MLLPKLTTLLMISIMAVATPVFADDDYDDDDYRRPVQTKTQRYIGHQKAGKIAIKRLGGGYIKEVDLDHDQRGAHYDVEIIKRGRKHKVIINAQNGRVLATYRD